MSQCLQVLSVCCLAPILMNGANADLPEFSKDYGPLFFKTASSVIQYVHRFPLVSPVLSKCIPEYICILLNYEYLTLIFFGMDARYTYFTYVSCQARVLQQPVPELRPNLVCRVKGASSSGNWDLEDVDFTDQNIYIFFGTLPRLLKAFAHSGVNAADETGNTVLHRFDPGRRLDDIF